MCSALFQLVQPVAKWRGLQKKTFLQAMTEREQHAKWNQMIYPSSWTKKNHPRQKDPSGATIWNTKSCTRKDPSGARFEAQKSCTRKDPSGARFGAQKVARKKTNLKHDLEHEKLHAKKTHLEHDLKHKKLNAKKNRSGARFEAQKVGENMARNPFSAK